MIAWWGIAKIRKYFMPQLYPLCLFSSRFYDKWYWPFKYLAFFSDVARIYKVLKQVQPDILHIHNGGYPGAMSCNAAVVAARMLKKSPKIVYFVNNMPKKRGLVQRMVELPIDDILDKKVDVFLSGSHAVSNELAKLFDLENFDYYGLSFETRARVIPNTIHEYPIKIIDKKRMGVKPGDVVICSAGVLEKRKGHTYLIKAIEQVLRGGQENVFLWIVGQGPERTNLVRFITVNAQIPCKVALIYADVDPYSYINACDIYVQPSIEHEDFPISVLQAMKLGKPIIGTTVAGIVEQVEPFLNGVLVPPRDVGALAEAIRKLVQKLGLRKQMGKASRERYGKHFYYDKIMAEYVKFYKELLG